MGKRSRKRGAQGIPSPKAVEAAAAAPPARPRRKSRMDDAPPSPWGRFPLIEIVTLIAIVILVWGFVRGGDGGAIMIATGAALGSLAGLELSLREHLSGHRSHTLVLSAVPAVALGAILFFARVPRIAVLLGVALVFGTAFWALRELFKRRTGGLGFRA